VVISAAGKADVTLVLFDTADPDVKELRLDTVSGIKVGTLEKGSGSGSVVAKLDASYLDTLGNNTYTIKVAFGNDGFKSGTGETTLRIIRPTNVYGVSIGGIANNAKFSYKASGVGNTLKLTASISPANADNKAVIWTSSNLGVATVDANGLVTFKGPEGIVVITATARDGSGKSGTVTINAVKNVTKVRVPMKKVNLSVKKKTTIPVALDDGQKLVIGSKLTFVSAKPAVATVDAKGNVKAGKKAGKTKITVMAANGAKTVVSITVAKKVVKLKKLTLSGVGKKGLTLKAKKIKDLKIKLSPSKANNLKVSFKSSKSKIASVDAAGRITALKKGKGVITVKVGTKKVKIKITVK
jgi:uncharacterized protein YjdB